MLSSGALAKQRVCVLDKYIHKHNLLAVKGKNKPQKVNAIMDHLRSQAECVSVICGAWVAIGVYPFFKECFLRLGLGLGLGLACGQATLRGALAEERERERELATTSLGLNILNIEKVDAKC